MLCFGDAEEEKRASLSSVHQAYGVHSPSGSGLGPLWRPQPRSKPSPDSSARTSSSPIGEARVAAEAASRTARRLQELLGAAMVTAGGGACHFGPKSSLPNAERSASSGTVCPFGGAAPAQGALLNANEVRTLGEDLGTFEFEVLSTAHANQHPNGQGDIPELSQAYPSRTPVMASHLEPTASTMEVARREVQPHHRCVPERPVTQDSRSTPARIFSRDLSPKEIAEVGALLDPCARTQLDDAVAREFAWAVASGGRAPGVESRVDYAGALFVLRQLAYSQGLPSLNTDAAAWFLDAHNVRRSTRDKDICLEEFRAAFVHLLDAAATQREVAAIAQASQNVLAPSSLLPSSSKMVLPPCTSQHMDGL